MLHNAKEIQKPSALEDITKMGTARQILNQKIRDPTCDFRDIFICLKQLTNSNRPDWGNKVPSPLIVAVEHLRQDLVVLMVRQFKVDVNSVDKIYSEGNIVRPRSALHRAVDMNNSSMVMQLLRLGADPIHLLAWSQLPHVGLVFGSALDNAIFARYYAVQKTIEYFVKKEQEKIIPQIHIIIESPTDENYTGNIMPLPEIREVKRKQTVIDNFNEKVYEFFELSTEFKSIESRIAGEKRPKMDQIKTMEAYMNQQKNRKNFVEYDDLKILEQHLSDYLTLQTQESQETRTDEDELQEKEEAKNVKQRLIQELKTILECSQCCQLEENEEVTKIVTDSKMFSCSQGHLICNTCLQNVKISGDGFSICPMCIQSEPSSLRRNFLAEKLIETFGEVQPSTSELPVLLTL